MSLSEQLADSTGTYFGTGDGEESGPFVSRIEVSRLPNGGLSLDYEATSREQGVQHREHSLLCPGPDGRDRLFIAHSESPFVTEMVEAEAGSGRFVQSTPGGPYTMEVVIETPEPERLTYAWWWASAGEQPVEQSKADARLLVSGEG
jgi:hypothetical protein